MIQAQKLREAILAAPLETSNFGETPQEGTLYLPPSHLKALKLDAHIVVGGRGVGKSFWTAALLSKPLRDQLGLALADLQSIEVSAGFSQAPDIARYPDAEVFAAFLGQGGDPYDLWRAVILRWVAEKADISICHHSRWQETVEWLKQEPEEVAQLMQLPRDWKGLILFDALDRTSTDWRRMDDIVRGLLRAILWLKSFSGLYAKVFLREDQAERTVFNFPDASKLTATKTELTWARHDLHGLLWQLLVNAPDEHGELMRKVCAGVVPQEKVWQLAPEMKTETEIQKKAFDVLAGPWMGRDRRRGVPYTWSVGHLADGRGKTSPRSFLAAIRRAAEDSVDRYPQHNYALHFESIKRGIQKASEIRVQEMAEDYPWVPDVLAVLGGMNVPIDFDIVKSKWEEAFPNGARSVNTTHLPAQHVDRGWDGVRDDLQRLGLLETKKDGRIDMPDLYRVGFGLGRKGGVRPRN